MIHFPLTVMLPRVDDPPAAVSLLDIQHVLFPEFFSWPSSPIAGSSMAGRYGGPAPYRDLAAREKHPRRAAGIEPERVEVIHLGLDHDVFHPNGTGAAAFLALPGEPLAAQEPRAAVLGFHAGPPSVRSSA